jgi:ABC-2 type transport system permease protein
MVINDTLQLRNEHGWRRGFSNMLRKENGDWWGTRQWWVRSLIWTVILNGLVFIIFWIAPLMDGEDAPPASELIETGVEIFFTLLAFAAPIGVMIFVQGAIVSEKDSGTAAWVMSKPVSRSAFILSKFVSNALGILVVIVLLQSLILYGQILLKGGQLSFMPFIAALGLSYLHMLFYLTLGLMLGTAFSSRGPVIGISIAVLLGQLLITGLVEDFLPWFPIIEPKTVGDIAALVAQGRTLPPEWPIPVLVTAVASLLFIALAIWRFNREEF